MPDRLDNPTNDAPSGASPEPDPRVKHIPAHHHLDTDALSAFIDNRLEGDLSHAAAGHIASCSDCRRELFELRETVTLLNGLPQYRPRRSFVLGQEYAHPVRTSRFARLLPLLPRLQAAAAACLLLLLIVVAGDILTQIGEDSDNSAGRSADPAQIGGDTAFEPDAANQDGSGAVAGDGTGGGASGGEPAGQVDDAALGEAPPPAGELPGSEISAASEVGGEVASAADSESISAAAPQSAASDGVGDAEATGDDEAGQEEAAEADLDADSDNADGAEAADSAVLGDGSAAREPAPAEDAAESANAGAEAGTDGDQERTADLLAPTVASGNAEPVPTIWISTEAPAGDTSGEIAQADSSGATAPHGRRAGTASGSGISNWRLIEIALGTVLVVLAALVVVLHRLNARARRIGIR